MKLTEQITIRLADGSPCTYVKGETLPEALYDKLPASARPTKTTRPSRTNKKRE
jgi:hypothetical protein